MKKAIQRGAVIIPFLLLFYFISCSKKSSPTDSQSSPYAGTWEGTTSQNRSISFSVTEEGIINNLTCTIRISVGNYRATINYSADDPVTITRGAFDVFLSVPITNVSTTLHGTFNSESTASGTYDEFSDDFYYNDGSTLIFGTGGTQISAGTWEATKVGGVEPEPDPESTNFIEFKLNGTSYRYEYASGSRSHPFGYYFPEEGNRPEQYNIVGSLTVADGSANRNKITISFINYSSFSLGWRITVRYYDQNGNVNTFDDNQDIDISMLQNRDAVGEQMSASISGPLQSNNDSSSVADISFSVERI